ncbi:FERM domain-containing protein 4B isoform X2 [Brachyhypopomus gauderio]|uniref:FERM domain-containing protein 4B isoform X2 n=1 Tax=Brachyhypopomus gauderio TaxID=698409 RepID=UPI004041EA08
MALGFLCGIDDLLASGSQLAWTVAEQVLRRCYNDGVLPCRRLLQTWCHIGDVYQMTEGRLCQVLLLDDRQLELLVQPKLLSRDLLDLVSSHFNLKEKEYFGISFTDETGQTNWLQLNRRVLEHDFCKKTGPLQLKFQVRFYVESIIYLKDTTTVELFYRNAKSSVYNGSVQLESENVFKLAAYVLQEAKGDYTSDESAQSELKKLPTFPTAVLKEHPSLAYCENKVIEHYKTLKGLSRGKAIVQYLLLVESLPTYGVHYYEVKDKQGIPWWLGISYKGIGQYDQQDKLTPRKIFHWKQLENLYFREKKFAVEVNDSHRRATSKRTFGQSGQAIHTWYASHSLIKTIWAMAISQHQFYLDCKQSKAKITTAKSVGDIAMDLTDIGAPRISKMVSKESKNHLIMASNGSLVSAGSGDSEAGEELKKEKIAEMRKKEKHLQDILTQKLDELKKICLREAELTGKLPKDYPLESGEKPPAVRRRVGTAFKLDDLFPYDTDPQLRNLESQFALQQKIVEAAKKLANETELHKTVKKKRRRIYLDAVKKLQDIENEMNDYRVKNGKTPTQRASLIISDDVSTADLSSLSDSLNLDDDEDPGSQRRRSHSTLSVPYLSDRRASANDQQPQDADRLHYGEVQQSYPYVHQDVYSTHSSPFSAAPRLPRDARSMPPTPQLTRNAFSSIQLRSEDDGPCHFRQRSGSLESQTVFPPESDVGGPAFAAERDGPESVFSISSVTRRSNSTDVLDDVSSHTSQSSAEYSAHSRARDRHRRRRTNMYANTGSMPNLVQGEAHHPARQPRLRPTTTAYYVTGYPEPQLYANGGYVCEDEVEGHYNVNPSYHRYPSQETFRGYRQDEVDCVGQNLYATLRQSRNRPPPRNENLARNLHKAMVAEHLLGWYNRNAVQKQAAYEYERGAQHGTAYRAATSTYNFNECTAPYAPANASNWRGQLAVGLSEYNMVVHSQQGYGYGTAHHSQPSHSSRDPCLLAPRPGPLVDRAPPAFARSPAPGPLDMPGAGASGYDQDYYFTQC